MGLLDLIRHWSKRSDKGQSAKKSTSPNSRDSSITETSEHKSLPKQRRLQPNQPKEYGRTLQFNEAFEKLLKADHFIARSDYKHLIDSYKDLAQFYATLSQGDLREDYIAKNHLDAQEIDTFLRHYHEICVLTIESPTVKEHNNQFVKHHLATEKAYLDEILKPCDPNILLDDEQREVVLSDEDNTLVIAGAGAGKTTTIAAKVRYLVERKHISPQDILVISFTNKAVDELRDRVNVKLHIPCPVTTFHSTGYTILRESEGIRRTIKEGGFMYHIINTYLKQHVLTNHDLVKKLVLFFGSYFTAPYEGDELNAYFQFVAKADYSTLKGNLHEYLKQIIDRKTHKVQTLNNEVLRSMEEVRIANFLYMHQIDYEYEPIYQYRILDARKPYTPDFVIHQQGKQTYIEHFGITESGHNNRYDAATLEQYKKRINDKILLHRKHNTDLIYTFSQHNDGRTFIEHLKEQLLMRGYELKPRPSEEVYKRLIETEESHYITRLTLLLTTFIGNFKTQGYKADKFAEFKAATKNVRTRLFLDICSVCYAEYQRALDEQNCMDFQDMINNSAEVIRQRQAEHKPLNYKYIIVDEYQDISRQRYNLVRELSKLCHAKIMAVGDDWQSIYAFSGSILPLFTQFCQEVGYGEELKITRTYRNAQEIIDIAGTFVQQNTAQIKKQLLSPKRIENPVTVYSYQANYGDKETKNKGGIYVNLGKKLNEVIGDILAYNKAEQHTSTASILLIGRYGFDAQHLCYSHQFNYDERSGKIYSVKYGERAKLQFLTAHSSKGLSADNVVIVNAKDATYGFPSKVDDDPVLNLVVENDQTYNYAEERRLFYVALTRTKNRVFILTPEKRPSVFIKELLSQPTLYPNVQLKGDINNDLSTEEAPKNRCPICGYPMQLRWNKNYGLRLWICTNDQEVCGFMTNDLKGGKLAIQKCDACQDGYLVVKNLGNHYFLGCTNYKQDRTGCGRTMSASQYFDQRASVFGEEDLSKTKPKYQIEKQQPSTLDNFEQKETADAFLKSRPKPQQRKIQPQAEIVAKEQVQSQSTSESQPQNEDSPLAKTMNDFLEKLQSSVRKKTSRRSPCSIKQQVKLPIEQEPRKKAIHRVEYHEQVINTDGFDIICDEKGNALTNLSLLKELQVLRNHLAAERKVRPYMVFHNKVLVSMATDKPSNRQEFLAIKGVGEKLYDEYGEQFIAIIKKHL